jgi:hypothetical protein
LKDTYYSKFFTLFGGTTIPTAQFKEEFITMPGLQNGTGAFTFTGGLLFSNRYKDFWFHSMASYTTLLENGKDYKFGDTPRFGAAVHYTPAYYFMAGLEIDNAYSAKDKYRGDKVNNTGGFRSNLSGVTEWKFLTALGGNFSLRLCGGVPVYENLRHYRVGQSEKAKLGGGYFFTAMINFGRRIPPI